MLRWVPFMTLQEVRASNGSLQGRPLQNAVHFESICGRARLSVRVCPALARAAPLVPCE